MPNDIFSKLELIIKDVKPSAEITMESELREDLDFDSLDNMSLLFEIEKVFDIKVPDPDVIDDNFFTIKKTVTYIKRRLNG